MELRQIRSGVEEDVQRPRQVGFVRRVGRVTYLPYWKARPILAIMESRTGLPTPAKRPRSRWLKRRSHGDHRWLRTYRARGKSAAVLAALAILAVSGLGLRVVGR